MDLDKILKGVPFKIRKELESKLLNYEISKILLGYPKENLTLQIFQECLQSNHSEFQLFLCDSYTDIAQYLFKEKAFITFITYEDSSEKELLSFLKTVKSRQYPENKLYILASTDDVDYQGFPEKYSDGIITNMKNLDQSSIVKNILPSIEQKISHAYLSLENNRRIINFIFTFNDLIRNKQNHITYGTVHIKETIHDTNQITENLELIEQANLGLSDYIHAYEIVMKNLLLHQQKAV